MAELETTSVTTSKASLVNDVTTYFEQLQPNTKPVLGPVLISSPWNTPYTFTIVIIDNEFSDVDGDGLLWTKIDSLPLRGKLKLSGVPVKVGDVIPLAGITALTYSPTFGQYGDGFDTFLMSVLDDGQAANLWSDSAIVTFDITNVNAKPTVTNSETLVPNRGEFVFTSASLLADYNDVEGDLVQKIEFTSVPPDGGGELYLDDVKVEREHLPFSLTPFEIDQERLKYVDSGDIAQEKDILIDYIVHDNSQ